jgi:hypothetical protein
MPPLLRLAAAEKIYEWGIFVDEKKFCAAREFLVVMKFHAIKVFKSRRFMREKAKKIQFYCTSTRYHLIPFNQFKDGKFFKFLARL